MLDGPFRGSEALAAGLLSHRQMYGRRYRRIFPDVYLPADLEPTLKIRSRAAFLLVRDRGGMLAGYSAAALLGADCAPRDVPAEVLVPRFLRAHPGLSVGYQRPDVLEIVTADGCRVTSPRRTGWDLARRLPLVEAVVAVDALTYPDRFDPRGFRPADLLTLRAQRPGAAGCGRLDEVVALANPLAESPMETRLRLALRHAGLPAPEVQYEILDRNWNPIARVDLAYPAAKLAIEYDGEVHFDARARARDLRRDNELARYGWHTMRLDKRQATTGLARTVENIRIALARRVTVDQDRHHHH
ncbi:hypothetical protein GCM10023321_44140 [Pseudonocardia eucalypti]|uniref:DUF559 domain-containing protein n=1 Tax=Pseudonocardia eucalypti TaxID=648755 RepID=A0ABP9QEY7_9PSEU|nr:hypothetical protein [Pseudonocardia eucalypti]